MFQLNANILFLVSNLNDSYSFNINVLTVLGFGGRGGGNSRGAGQQQRGGQNKFRGK